MRKWEIDAKAFELDKHMRDCRHNNQPFIKARKNMDNSNYYVSIDLITCDYRLDEKKQKLLKVIFEDEEKFLKSRSDTKSFFKGFNIQNELSYFDGVNQERLENFLDQVYKIILK